MESGFFKWVWRFNGVIIAIGSSLLLFVLVWEGTAELRRESFPTQTTNTVALPSSDEESGHAAVPTEISRRFGIPVGNGNRALYALPLYIEQEYPNRGISKSSGGNIVNYRIVGTDAQTNRWLFAPADRLIVTTNELRLPAQSTQRTVGYLLTVVETDTNDDGRLSARDTKSLYLTSPEWDTPRKVTEGVISVLEREMIDASQLDVIFDTADGTHATRVSMRSGAILSEQVFSTRD